MTDRRVLIDTGPLISLVSKDDENHQLCVQALGTISGAILTCWPVLTEAAWMLRRKPHGFARIVSSCGSGLFTLADLDSAALVSIYEIMHRYEDSGIQLADAALAYLAEREGIRTVFTLDRRDFSIIRLKRIRALTIIP